MKIFAGRRILRVLLLAACAFLSLAPRHAAAQAANGPAAPRVQPAKLQFFLRLIPPRPTFAVDMSSHEREVMEQHAAYWADLFKSGRVLIIGPVNDPKGVFGMAVLEVATEAEAHAMADNDPSVKAGVNKLEVVPMHVFLRKE